MTIQRHATRHFGYVRDAAIAEQKRRAERAEFLLAILAQCVGSRFYAIHEALYPGPVHEGNGVWVDGSEAARAARHDIIRKLFHD